MLPQLPGEILEAVALHAALADASMPSVLRCVSRLLQNTPHPPIPILRLQHPGPRERLSFLHLRPSGCMPAAHSTSENQPLFHFAGLNPFQDCHMRGWSIAGQFDPSVVRFETQLIPALDWRRIAKAALQADSEAEAAAARADGADYCAVVDFQTGRNAWRRITEVDISIELPGRGRFACVDVHGGEDDRRARRAVAYESNKFRAFGAVITTVLSEFRSADGGDVVDGVLVYASMYATREQNYHGLYLLSVVVFGR